MKQLVLENIVNPNSIKIAGLVSTLLTYSALMGIQYQYRFWSSQNGDNIDNIDNVGSSKIISEYMAISEITDHT